MFIKTLNLNQIDRASIFTSVRESVFMLFCLSSHVKTIFLVFYLILLNYAEESVFKNFHLQILLC